MLIISLSVAVIIIYAAVFFLQLKRTMAEVSVFIGTINGAVTPLLQETLTLSKRINNLSGRITDWFVVKNRITASAHELAVIMKAMQGALVVSRGKSGTKSAFSKIVDLLTFLRRR